MKKENPALTQAPVGEKDAAQASSTDAAEPMPDKSPLPNDMRPEQDALRPEEDVLRPEGTGGAEPSADAPSGAGPGSSDETGDVPVADDTPALLKPPAARDAEPRGKGGGVPLFIALVALVGVALIGWQVWELRLMARETRQEVAQRLASGDGAVSEIRALTRQQQESIATLLGRFGALQSQVAATEGQAAALEALYLEYSRSRSDQALAEVEQAINIAAQQLHLAGNFEAALIALQGAEARLAMPDQGHLQALRRALIKDIGELEAHPQVDVSGLALRLEILLERLDRLPLAFEVELAAAAAARAQERDAVDTGSGAVARALEFSRALAADIWNEIKGMVRLERMDQADPVLLAPAQSTYLRENVKIRLLTARLALLARDGRTYSADLTQAREWIERYFDTADEEVRRVITDLTELEQVQVKAEPPSLSETFAALRLVQARASSSRSPDGQREEPVESPPVDRVR